MNNKQLTLKHYEGKGLYSGILKLEGVDMLIELPKSGIIKFINEGYKLLNTTEEPFIYYSVDIEELKGIEKPFYTTLQKLTYYNNQKSIDFIEYIVKSFDDLDDAIDYKLYLESEFNEV